MYSLYVACYGERNTEHAYVQIWWDAWNSLYYNFVKVGDAFAVPAETQTVLVKQSTRHPQVNKIKKRETN